MADSAVRPFYRLVANGIENNRLKATLIISPETALIGSHNFPLKDWPLRMARILNGVADHGLRPEISLQIFAGEDAGKIISLSAADIKIVGHGEPHPAGWRAVNELWQKSIVGAAGKLADVWGALRSDIELSLTGQKHEGDPQASYQGKIASDPGQGSFDKNGAIVARRPNPSDMIKVAGVVANNQHAVAIDEERVRAQRVLRRMLAGPGLPGDDDSLPEDASIPHEGNYKDLDPKQRKEEFQKIVRARMFKDFQQIVDDTKDSRATAKARFDSIKKILNKGAGAKPAASSKPTPSSIASADRVMKGTDPDKVRAGHVYGGWLQSVDRLEQVADGRPYAAHPSSSSTAEDATALERVRGVYYSFQGDALLSRLFCLAADVTIAVTPELIAAMKKGPVYLYLASEKCEEKRITAQIFTGAKLDGSQFWPVSRFDVPGTDPDVATLVEQRAGIWMLGEGYGTGDADGPRYHLASVDFRRSVDSTSDAIDRGQRHNTAGMTVLDRDRAEQIARDLAISSVQRQAVCDQAQHKCNVANRNCVELFAEELTVGRRLDIAVVKEKSQVKNLDWRSLMHRRIAFDMEPAVKKILKQVTGDKSPLDHFHDETSFQVVTRSMPLLGVDDAVGGTRQVEAIADEAIVTWDGTPLAALARQDSDEKKPHEGPRLPFTRTYSLEVDGANRPPPLRYGVGYTFAMRSVFVGGGSPPAAVHRTEDGGHALPPAVTVEGNRVPARKRFLRHESIDAPPILLPKHIAEEKAVSVMGFEISDRVALRSFETPAVQPKELPDRYIAPKDRARPDQSMRIFVAPSVALDTAIRHRKLDHNGLEVMRGGLRNVLYDPAKDGFPLVVTQQAAEFNGDLALVSRTIVQNATNADAKDKKQGATVFVPGGVNPTPSGKIGYLPDPAAENMVVRLRIRGSDRYLKGSWITPLYDKSKNIAYPNALPLVVSIEKLPTQRPVPARACGEILLGDPKATRKLAPNGTFGSGVEVRHLTVRLAPGEDFDMEIVCLPDSKTLAQTFSLPETIALQVHYSAKDTCGADDLICLCGAGSEGRLAHLREVVRGTKPATEIGLGGRAAPGPAAVEGVAMELINTITSNWQIEELAAVQTLRVTHAINVPLQAPDIVLTGVKRPTVKKDSALDVILNAPSSQSAVTALLQGKIGLDLEQTGAFELTVTTPATGGKPFDDKSRSRSLLARRSGRWPELITKGGEARFVSTQDVLGFEVGEDGRVTFPKENVTILRVDNLPDPRGLPPTGSALDFARTNGRRTEIDLAVLHAAAIAKQAIEIPVATDAPCPTGRTQKIVASTPIALEDVRARKICVTAVAISRSSPLFQTAAFYTDPDKLLKRRQALVPEHQSSFSKEVEFWIPATIRPARCDARPPAPNFVFERSSTKVPNGSSRQLVTRTARTRLHFGRGMFDSGEGERIGIVLWPPNYAMQDPSLLEKNYVVIGKHKMKLVDLDDADLGPGGRFVTRWGGDPIRKDLASQTGNFIPASAFRDLGRLGQGPHRPGYVPRARMPIDISEEVDPATGQVIVKDAAPPEFLDVSLLTYEPCFDLDREEWYVDVDLHPTLATDPFVRFGLVRYQEHSINPELMLSEPIVVWAQVLPRRSVTLTHTIQEDGIQLNAIVSGQASDGIKAIKGMTRPLTPNEKDTLALLRRPVMQMTIVHEGVTAHGVLTRTPVSADGVIEARGEPSDGLMRWELVPKVFTMSRALELGKGALVAYIEEVEKRMPATYPSEPISADAMLVEETIVSSGPRFSARIVFHKIP